MLQRVIDKPLAGDPAEAGKSDRRDRHREMGLPFRPGAGMPGMAVRFVDYIEPGRGKPLGQLVADRFCDAHRGRLRPGLCRAPAAARKPARSSTTWWI